MTLDEWAKVGTLVTTVLAVVGTTATLILIPIATTLRNTLRAINERIDHIAADVGILKVGQATGEQWRKDHQESDDRRHGDSNRAIAHVEERVAYVERRIPLRGNGA